MDVSIRGHAPRRLSTGGLLGRQQGKQAVVVFLAGGATFEVRAHAGDLPVRGGACELELDPRIQSASEARRRRGRGPA